MYILARRTWRFADSLHLACAADKPVKIYTYQPGDAISLSTIRPTSLCIPLSRPHNPPLASYFIDVIV